MYEGRKIDRYDYLITKCDNSISQAFLTYFILQSATKQFYYKVSKLLFQSASGITKFNRWLLQSASGITKCDSYYKVRHNTFIIKLNIKSFMYL